MFSIENQNSKTYLTYVLQDGDQPDTLSLGMMNNNNINGMLPMVFTQIDDKIYIKYDITSKIPASQIFSGAVNKRWVTGVFSSIINAAISAEEFMININSLILDLDFIYVDISKATAELVCLPIVNNNTVDFSEFFKKIMFTAQFDRSENSDYVAKIISFLNSSQTFSLYDFKKVINDLQLTSSVNFGQTGTAGTKVQTVGVQQAVSTSPAAKSTVNSYPKPQPFEYKNQNQFSVQSQVPAKASQKTDNRAVPNTQNVNNVYNNQPITQVPNRRVQNQQIPNFNMPNTQMQAAQPQRNEKKMSWFYLMCHYNKDNAAAYKAQKNSSGMNPSGTYQQPPKQAHSNIPNGVTIPGAANQRMAVPNGMNSNAIANNASNPVKNKQPVINQTYNRPQNSEQPQSAFTQPSSVQTTVVNIPKTTPKVAENVSAGFNTQTNVQAVSTSGYAQQYTTSVGDNFGATTVLGESTDGETVVLGESESNVKKKPVIVRLSTNEVIPVNKDVFKIGKEKSFVDYFIGDNSYISRGHACIVTRDENYFIIDNNSRNHTYVNGNIIPSSTETELKNGYTFKLANEAFEFKLY